jgi:hypothetical protein
MRKPITGIADCCARAANGHAATATPRTVINSRRLIRLSSSSYVGAGFIAVLL